MDDLPAIKAEFFALLDSEADFAELKRLAITEDAANMAAITPEQVKAKYEIGEKEHGVMTEEHLHEFNINAALQEENIDRLAYHAFRLKRDCGTMTPWAPLPT